MKEIWIHQESYIKYLCDQYKMTDANPVSLPMDPNHPFGCDTDSFPAIQNLKHTFQKLVSELMYLLIPSSPGNHCPIIVLSATCMQMDIAHVVQHLSQQCAHPEAQHYAAGK
ncbi:hypothetical protein PAXRUDRAFT_157285 [Paxillus rubicundulus Ve08.2h10]|uniref:Uncharacterized protein n=1 Tax=Paxillus rubicundulus Ve08.2h10 TaxID=930991 RepID=A0A0D0DAK8_9AGAM|nr:hypothetical protein PAXRUDRAFT_157285 [Paxillus rubicundulus Ve08.2h10]